MAAEISARMKLFVLGATGKTGVHLIEQGLERGHEITAFVRSPGKVSRRDAKLTVKAGDPTKAAEIAAALPGHDAVLSVIGAAGLGPTSVHTDCARATVDAMGTAGVRRLIAVSTAFLFPDVGFFGNILRRLVFKNLVADHRGMEHAIQTSPLDWTLVRPPRLLPGPALGRYRVADEELPAGGSTLRFADVAHFMLDAAEKSQHVKHVAGACY
jgi:putative NADH-flavin reductase